jgi:hypothetical protein
MKGLVSCLLHYACGADAIYAAVAPAEHVNVMYKQQQWQQM